MKYEVWSEGYVVTGNQDTAKLWGTVEAESFQKACDYMFESKNNRKYYRPETLEIWGCRLFDNETDARKAFG